MEVLKRLWDLWKREDEWWPLNALLVVLLLPALLIILVLVTTAAHVLFERMGESI